MSTIAGSDQDVLDRAADAPMLRNTEAWAAVNSGSDNLDGMATMAGLLADAFSSLPGDLCLDQPATATRVTPAGSTEEVPLGRNLHLRVRPHAPVQILLTGHMDTVFGADHGFQSLAWRDADTLNGPGVADMKGGVALMLAALQAVEASPLAATLGYEVVINSDEEIGSPGSAPLIARAAQGKIAALTYEPALPDGNLAGDRPGSGNFSFIVRGRSAHAGRNPEDGRNAIVAAADLALRLRRVAGPDLSVNPARIEGGSANNVVPDNAVLRVNLRPKTPDDQRRAQAQIDAVVADVSAEHDVHIHVHGGFGRPPKPVDAAAGRLFDLVAGCGRALGLDLARVPTGGVCDGNNIAACGVPVVDTMGAVGGAIHSADEFLRVSSLAERARLSALVLLTLAAKGAP